MASAQVNGHKEHDAQAAFLDQWLQLKDAVLADRHPRFKLPAAVKERLQPAIKAASTSTHTSAAQLPGLSNGSGSARLPSGSHNSSAASLVNTKAFAQNTSTAAGLAASKSGIDPVLLTKSEDLIRAEMQLKRQRIERQLKDSADQRKHGFRARDNEETAPLVALTETLKRALEIVKPISGLEPPANAQTAASDSFDENSYYSSQANDWSSEDASPKGRKAEAASSLHQTAGLASNASKNHAFSVERLDRQPPPQSHTLNQIDAETTYDAEREDSDEYSPPAADAFSGPDADADAMDIDDGKWPLHAPDTARLSNGSRQQQRVCSPRRSRSFTSSTPCHEPSHPTRCSPACSSVSSCPRQTPWYWSIPHQQSFNHQQPVAQLSVYQHLSSTVRV